MNSNEDISSLVEEMSSSIEKYSDMVDTDNLIAIMIEFCRLLAASKNLRNKELRRSLKNIIDIQLR